MDTVSIARWLYAIRGLRPGSHIDGLYADPAWDILLDLYIREKSNARTSISSACIAARSPATTALRYVTLLCEEKLLERQPDADDRRRHWLRLSRDTAVSLEEYMTAISGALSAFAADISTDVDLMKVAETIRKAGGLMRTAESALARLENRFGQKADQNHDAA